MASLKLSSIIEALGGRLLGDAKLQIAGLAPLQTARQDQISFLSHPRYESQLTKSLAGCVIVSPAFEGAVTGRAAAIVTDDPYLYFARLTRLWKSEQLQPLGPRIHPTAVVDPEATIAEDAVIGPLCVVERGARVGAA